MVSLSARSNIIIGIFFILTASVMAGGLAMVLVGLSLDHQLDIYEWDHDISSASEDVQNEFEVKRFWAKFFEFVGIFFSSFGTLLVLTLYKQLK